jgi:PAS domain S-box-containing protein
MDQTNPQNIKNVRLPSVTGDDAIADLLPDIVAEVDNGKKYTYLNAAGLEFFGNDAIGQEASSFFEGEQQTYKKVAPLFEGKDDIFYLESWQRRKDGQKRLLAWWCRPLKDSQGQTIGALSTAHDITEHFEVVKKLNYSEAQLYNALSLARLGPWEYDAINDLFTFNDTFYKLFRTTAKDAGGYTMPSAEYAKRFVHPDDAPLVGMEVQKSMETKDPSFTRTLEHRIIYADGQIGHIAVRFFIVKDGQGRTIQTYGINQDITEQKNRELELLSIKDELQKKIDELEDFNKIMVNREMKMVEMKNRIKELEERLGPGRLANEN